ncbi:chromatin assembly factor 1 subunit FAS1-like [Chenopodium quinoa]|uniref:chromatin assembly factor 1 subunit FAS1-like n=1 Tax=Chenopodium quinoa TaxID=63459 RepID=UPI000B78A7A3|nr:chromatin assembly factor 1 subunit FAS1-like [Chenopodium quinoa]
MADPMEIDEAPNPTPKQPPLKRKREKQKVLVSSPEERESRLKSLNEELESLFRYFDEVLSIDLGLTLHFSSLSSSNNVNAMIAVLLEEKRCSYSKLVGEIYEKAKERENEITIANVKSSVLFAGQRVAYGVPNADADVLEDETGSYLWCWETRDMKLLPSSLRGALKIRRTCRKKINERITAVSDVITFLQKSEDDPTCKADMTKAVEKLSKVLAEADIRLLVESLNQKNDSELAEKEAKKKESTLIKEFEKSKREVEKEKKKMDRELQKEKLQSEKEKKRLQQEAERDEKRREKEESEMRKQLKRKQEEADREQRRKEKEEAEIKKQLTIQKQASIMERFLKKSKTTQTSQSDQSPKAATLNHPPNESVLESVSLLMDSALQQQEEIDVDEIRKSHMSSWRSLGHSIRSNPKQNWGLRHKPKGELIKELKLTSNKGPTRDDDVWIIDSIADEWGQTSTDDKSCQANTSASPSASKRRKQLLQFDKSCRPAFYGIWPKKSCVIGPRHPLKRDPDLEYEIDSDEEWEEEDPGESLSDSEKEEEEILDEGSLKVDDDEESEDDFFVPDGYLSENEGVDTDRGQSNFEAGVTTSPLGCKPETLSEENSSWMRQQKYLHNLTELALRKNQPLIVVNMMHDKAHLLSPEDLTGSLKVEQMCLQALSMRVFPGGMSIEVPSDNNLREENQDACTSNSKGSTAATVVVTPIPDSDLPKIVSIIQSCPQGINRVLESLQQSFPDIPKTHLRNKVREISEFVDNRWKVKKEILVKLGMSSTPEKSGGRTRSIATFFSKRCLPPAGNVGNSCDSSPESIKPTSSSQQPQQAQQQVRSENV